MLAETFISIAAIATSLPLVCADGASIVAAIAKIDSATAALNNSVLAWDGSLLGALPIVADSATLLSDINAGTKVVQASANLTDLESISVYFATLDLSSDVNLTLASVEAAKPKFQKLLLAPIILLDLEADKSATDTFSTALISKVPSSLQSIAAGVVSEIDAAFDTAIDDYSLTSDF